MFQLAEVADFVKASESHVVSLTAELAKVNAMMPVEEMNLEEYFDAFPNQVSLSKYLYFSWPKIIYAFEYLFVVVTVCATKFDEFTYLILYELLGYRCF